MILGIDPGRHGSFVLLGRGACVAQLRTADIIGTAKWEASHAEVTAALRSLHAEHRIRLAVLERASVRPGEGRGSGLTTGIGWGLLLGAVSALEVPVLMPTAAQWTRALFVGVPGEGKERSVAVARTIPGLDLTPGRCTKPQDGLADAGCLALWGGMQGLGRGT